MGAGQEQMRPAGRKQVWCCFPPPAPAGDPISLRRFIRGGFTSPPGGRQSNKIHELLMNIAFTPCDHGVSWLELYMGFLILHDCTHVCDRTKFAEVTVHHELTEFRRLCNHEIEHEFHADGRELFRPTDRRDAKLRHVGFCSPVACIRGVPDWSPEVWRRIVEMCVLLRGCSQADAAIICGAGNGSPHIRLSLKRAVPWKCRGQCAGGPSRVQGWKGYCPACNGLMHLPAPCQAGGGVDIWLVPHMPQEEALGACQMCQLLNEMLALPLLCDEWACTHADGAVGG